MSNSDDEIKKRITASCMRMPYISSPDLNEIKRRVQEYLSSMVAQGMLTYAEILEDTLEEKLVREIMEEEDTIRMSVRPVYPITHLQVNFKIGDDS